MNYYGLAKVIKNNEDYIINEEVNELVYELFLEAQLLDANGPAVQASRDLDKKLHTRQDVKINGHSFYISPENLKNETDRIHKENPITTTDEIDKDKADRDNRAKLFSGLQSISGSNKDFDNKRNMLEKILDKVKNASYSARDWIAKWIDKLNAWMRRIIREVGNKPPKERSIWENLKHKIARVIEVLSRKLHNLMQKYRGDISDKEGFYGLSSPSDNKGEGWKKRQEEESLDREKREKERDKIWAGKDGKMDWDALEASVQKHKREKEDIIDTFNIATGQKSTHESTNLGSLIYVMGIDENATLSEYDMYLMESTEEATEKNDAQQAEHNAEEMYKQLQYKGMAAPRQWIAKILKWANKKAYEFNRKVKEAGPKAQWWKKALSVITNIIEWCTRKLHNLVANKDNQIGWKSEDHAKTQFAQQLDKTKEDHNNAMKNMANQEKETINKINNTPQAKAVDNINLPPPTEQQSKALADLVNGKKKMNTDEMKKKAEAMGQNGLTFKTFEEFDEFMKSDKPLVM